MRAAGQHAAVVAANGARAHHGDLEALIGPQLGGDFLQRRLGLSVWQTHA